MEIGERRRRPSNMHCRRDFLSFMAAAPLLPTNPATWAKADALSSQADSPNFPVVRNGEVYLKGERYRAIGCNFYDVLDHADLLRHLSLLKSFGVPFIRCNLGAFDVGMSPESGWRMYVSNRDKWYGQRDGLIAAAEYVGIGIIPSFFWRLKTVPELMAFVSGNSSALPTWDDRESASRNFVRQVTSEIVERYHKSSAIWGWEIGNEFSALPVSEYHARRLSAARNPSSPSAPSLTVGILWDIYSDWAAAVHGADTSGRLLSSGDTVANYNLYHWVTQASDTPDYDTYDEWMHIPFKGTTIPAPLLLNPPSIFNSISTHIYQQPNLPGLWFKGAGGKGAGALVKLHKQLSLKYRMPLFIGEFGSLTGTFGQDGARGTDGSEAGEKRYFLDFLQTIVSERVDLSAVWNYGYLPTNKVQMWNIDPGTRREYMLQAIGVANMQIAQ